MTQLSRRGVCLVISAPSGAGKSTITRELLSSEQDLTLSVSATTRQPRPGEEEGVHYFFRSPEAFAAMIEAGELLEWAEVFGRRYGTPRAPVEQALAAGRDVAFDIDWQGHRQLAAALPGRMSLACSSCRRRSQRSSSDCRGGPGMTPPRLPGACRRRATRSRIGPSSAMWW